MATTINGSMIRNGNGARAAQGDLARLKRMCIAVQVKVNRDMVKDTRKILGKLKKKRASLDRENAIHGLTPAQAAQHAQLTKSISALQFGLSGVITNQNYENLYNALFHRADLTKDFATTAKKHKERLDTLKSVAKLLNNSKDPVNAIKEFKKAFAQKNLGLGKTAKANGIVWEVVKDIHSKHRSNAAFTVQHDRKIYENKKGALRKANEGIKALNDRTDVLQKHLEDSLLRFAKQAHREMQKEITGIEKLQKKRKNIDSLSFGRLVALTTNVSNLTQLIKSKNASNKEIRAVLEKLGTLSPKTTTDLQDHFAKIDAARILKTKLAHMNPKTAVADYEGAYKTFEGTLLKGADAKTVRILKNIVHILLSLATAFTYTAGAAAYSMYTRKSPAFWKTNEELLGDKLKQAKRLSEGLTYTPPTRRGQ